MSLLSVFALAFYYLLKMGEDKDFRLVWRWAIAILLGLLFRPNILIFVPFSFAYLLLLKRYSLRELGKRGLVLALVLALFIVPWTVRNWKLYHAFIPVTYGAGNPLYEGSYQGVDVPSDEELGTFGENFDAYAAVSAKRPDLMDGEGRVFDPEMQQYADMLVAGELAHFRLGAWWKLRPMSLLKSYLYVKPRMILNWVWYYLELAGISLGTAHRMRQLGFLFCLLSLALSLKQKRFVKLSLFLAVGYLLNLYILASSFAIDRYAQMIMPYRYLLMGLGLELLRAEAALLAKRKAARQGK